MPATPEQRCDLIKQLHAVPLQLVLQVTGGGSLAISDLLTIPGGSRILLAAGMPYSSGALAGYIGRNTDLACNDRTARLIAMTAWHEARRFAGEDNEHTVGLGCTASLASDRPKRGAHRIHLAIQTWDQTRSWSLTLDKDRRTRVTEERLTADAILNFLRAQLQEFLPKSRELDLSLSAQEVPVEQHAQAPEGWQPLMLYDPYVTSGSGQVIAPEARTGLVIFPGSFAPLHAGHRQIAAFAEQRLGKPVIYELSASNVDKPPLDYWELQQRLRNFDSPNEVWLTNKAMFTDKAELFPRATFLVGVDTLKRIADPRYYYGQAQLCMLTVQKLAVAGCRFLVFGRVDATDKFQTLGDCDLPAELRALCEEIPECEFRQDVSSTELRKRIDETE